MFNVVQLVMLLRKHKASPVEENVNSLLNSKMNEWIKIKTNDSGLIKTENLTAPSYKGV